MRGVNSYTIFFIVHEDLFQGNNRCILFRSCFVDLTGDALVHDSTVICITPTQKYPLQAFPGTQIRECLSIRQIERRHSSVFQEM